MIRKRWHRIWSSVLIGLVCCTGLTGCVGSAPNNEFTGFSRFESVLSQAFDVTGSFLCYAKSEEEFLQYSSIIQSPTLQEYNDLYEIYQDPIGSTNLKTVNEQGGIAPISVAGEIIDLLLFGKEAYKVTNGVVNVAMGSVLSLWHEARTESLAHPENAYLPDPAALAAANKHTHIEDVIVDATEHTVFLNDAELSLDVGALAKGYATQVAIDRAKQAGMVSGLLNAGGNVIAVGRPMEEDKPNWRVGIQHPNSQADSLMDVIQTQNKAVVTSGSYQRFYEVAGNSYNHIISPVTLQPATLYPSVTVVCDDAAWADVLSTALFLLPLEEGMQLAEQFGAEAMWVQHDFSMVSTPGYEAYRNTQ